jgi:hypothetical protein
MAKKTYTKVGHTGKLNRTGEVVDLPFNDEPQVTKGHKIVHNVDADKQAAFEAHVNDFEAKGKRKEMGAKNKPF